MNRQEQHTLALQLGTPENQRPAPGVDSILKLSEGNSFTGAVLAGFVEGLCVVHGEELEVWATPEGRALLLKVLPDAANFPEGVPVDHDGNDYLVGRFGGGDRLALRELIRRAKHRDGSAAAIDAGDDALIILTTGSRGVLGLAALLAENGLGKEVKFGFHPVGSETAFLSSGARTPVAPVLVSPPPVPVAPAPAAPEPPVDLQPRPPASITVIDGRAAAVTVDLKKGVLLFGGNPMPVGTAAELADALNIGVRQLLIPAEGYTWVDDMRDPNRLTSLLCHDAFLAGPAEGLPGLSESDLGGFLRAVVERDPEPGVETFAWKIYTRDGATKQSAAALDSQDAAQVEVARQVRELPAGL
jgi:hypothetical protein